MWKSVNLLGAMQCYQRMFNLLGAMQSYQHMLGAVQCYQHMFNLHNCEYCTIEARNLSTT
jgi:hypothetical protein